MAFVKSTTSMHRRIQSATTKPAWTVLCFLLWEKYLTSNSSQADSGLCECGKVMTGADEGRGARLVSSQQLTESR